MVDKIISKSNKIELINGNNDKTNIKNKKIKSDK